MATMERLCTEIERLSQKLEEETYRYVDVCQLAAEADVTYKKHHSMEYLKAEGTAGQREATVALVVDDFYFARKIGEAKRESTLELLRSLRAQLDALRTLAANLRVQA